jgi:hypothetical protein
MRFHLRFLIRPAVISAIVALLFVGFLYGDAVSLPLFSDDLVQIPWLESISWRELWTSPSPYGYYRPLWYTIWRGWGSVVGGLHPVGLHLLNLIAHVVATWLTGLLVVRWLPRDSSRGEQAVAAGLAAAFFAVFPFSRQAVAWPGAVYNPLVSAMAAAAVLAYDLGRGGRGHQWIAIAFVLGILASFTYESGILVALLIVVVELIGWLSVRWTTRSWWPLAFAALVGVNLALWSSMRGAGVVASGLTSVDLWRNTAYLAQGLIYPLAPLSQCLVRWTRVDPVLALWLVALPAVLALGWQGMRSSVDVLLLGMGWFGVFTLPPLISMKADWFALAPRFLYMTAAGASLIWAAALAPWIARTCNWHQVVLTALVAAALLIPAASFVRDGLRLYRMAGESIWGAAKTVADGQRVLLVNLPRRITPNRRLYPLGFEGITPLPMRVTANGLAYVHTGVRDAAEAVAFGIAATDQPKKYTYELFGRLVGWQELARAAREAGTVYLTRYEPGRVRLLEAGGLEGALVDASVQARFGDRVDLLAVSGTCDRAGRVHLTTWWRARSDIDIDVSVFAHLLGAGGEIAAQADGRPLLGMLPFWLWDRGEVVRDVRHFAPVESGSYTIQLGIWEPATGTRWSAAGRSGNTVNLQVRCP